MFKFLFTAPVLVAFMVTGADAAEVGTLLTRRLKA